MEKKLAILQSNYIPWKGYFDLIHMVDEFILYDDRQYTKNDWRNRNLIKTSDGLKWLTIPVLRKGNFDQKICETKIGNPSWTVKHWKTLKSSYAKAIYFREYAKLFEQIYFECAEEEYLSIINLKFMVLICKVLGIKTQINFSTDYQVYATDKTQRLVNLCKAANATHYISGPAAKSYLDERLFIVEGITVSYMDYSCYKEYPQLHGGFEHGVSILDLIFNTGPNAITYMGSFLL